MQPEVKRMISIEEVRWHWQLHRLACAGIRISCETFYKFDFKTTLRDRLKTTMAMLDIRTKVLLIRPTNQQNYYQFDQPTNQSTTDSITQPTKNKNGACTQSSTHARVNKTRRVPPQICLRWARPRCRWVLVHALPKLPPIEVPEHREIGRLPGCVVGVANGVAGLNKVCQTSTELWVVQRRQVKQTRTNTQQTGAHKMHFDLQKRAKQTAPMRTELHKQHETAAQCTHFDVDSTEAVVVPRLFVEGRTPQLREV